jgi:hypothetical protein
MVSYLLWDQEEVVTMNTGLCLHHDRASFVVVTSESPW